MSNIRLPEKDVNEVIPGLWLGNCLSAYNEKFIREYNIKNVLTIMHDFDTKYRYNDVNYFIVPLRDVDICTLKMSTIFDATIKFVNGCLVRGENVLVHCKQGHHRSATIVVACLVRIFNMRYEAAILYIKSLRKFALRRETCILNALKRYLDTKNIH